MTKSLFAFVAGTFLASAAPPIAFEPMKPADAAAAEEYRRIWEIDGPKIVAALEGATGFPFPEALPAALVRAGPSMLAFDGRSMRLRASYGPEHKRAVLVHELGHLLALSLPRSPELDDHRVLYLFLYDVWSELYGQDFADRMVALERRNRAVYDYDRAWTWALSRSREERRTLLQALRSGR